MKKNIVLMLSVIVQMQGVQASQNSELSTLLDSGKSSYFAIERSPDLITGKNSKSWLLVGLVAVAAGVAYYCCCCRKRDSQESGLPDNFSNQEEELPQEKVDQTQGLNSPLGLELTNYNLSRYACTLKTGTLKAIPEEVGEDGSVNSPPRSSNKDVSFSGAPLHAGDCEDLSQLKLAFMNAGLSQEGVNLEDFYAFFHTFGQGAYDSLNLPFSLGVFMTQEESRIYLLHKRDGKWIKAFDKSYSLFDDGGMVNIRQHEQISDTQSFVQMTSDLSDRRVRKRILDALEKGSIFGAVEGLGADESKGTSSGGASSRNGTSSTGSRSSISGAAAKPLKSGDRLGLFQEHASSLLQEGQIYDSEKELYETYKNRLLNYVFVKESHDSSQYIVELMKSREEKNTVLNIVREILENPVSEALFLQVLFPVTEEDEALNLLLKLSGFELSYVKGAGLKYPIEGRKKTLKMPPSKDMLRTDKSIYVMSLDASTAFFKTK